MIVDKTEGFVKWYAFEYWFWYDECGETHEESPLWVCHSVWNMQDE